MQVIYTLSFRSKNQAPLLMITKGWWEDGEIDFAKIMFQIESWAQILKWLGLVFFIIAYLWASTQDYYNIVGVR
jgi:hypothetical protein